MVDDAIIDAIIHREAFLLLRNLASDLFFILSDQGVIIEANQAVERLTGRRLIGEKFQDILAYFKGTLLMEEVSAAPDQERIFNIDNVAGSPQSYYFTFKKCADHTLAFGRLNSTELEIARNEMFSLNQELNTLSRQLHKKNAELTNALKQIKTLQGILPICMHCHKIRNDQEVWDRLEAYIERQTEAYFSHSICPDCLNKLYPDEPDEPEE